MRHECSVKLESFTPAVDCCTLILGKLEPYYFFFFFYRFFVGGICFNSLSDKNGRPLILSDKNRGNVDSTCHQPVIYDAVTVNNCYL